MGKMNSGPSSSLLFEYDTNLIVIIDLTPNMQIQKNTEHIRKKQTSNQYRKMLRYRT